MLLHEFEDLEGFQVLARNLHDHLVGGFIGREVEETAESHRGLEEALPEDFF